jgi:hypothetical protein
MFSIDKSIVGNILKGLGHKKQLYYCETERNSAGRGYL